MNQLIELLTFRKKNWTKDYKMYRKKDPKKCKFIELCERVQTLVLDLMSKKLQSIFIEYSKTQLQRGIKSFEAS